MTVAQAKYEQRAVDGRRQENERRQDISQVENDRREGDRRTYSDRRSESNYPARSASVPVYYLAPAG